MKNVLNWMKANPISVVAAALVLVALGGFYVFAVRGGAKVQAYANEWNNHFEEVDRFMRQTVEVPNQDPQQPPMQVDNVTINPRLIDDMKDVYEKMGVRYDALHEEVVKHNKANHELLVPNVFSGDNIEDPYTFREKYNEAFQLMLMPYEGGSTLPRLNAGMPPTMEEIGDALSDAQNSVVESIRVTRGAEAEQLPEDIEKIQLAQQESLLEIIQNQAHSINIYSQIDPLAPDYPFHIGEWAGQTGSPRLFEIFEGQLELWIQQDIVEAIVKANQITIDQDGKHVLNPKASVLTAPVKRLIKIEVTPGYVGIQTQGGTDSVTDLTVGGGGSGYVSRYARPNVNYGGGYSSSGVQQTGFEGSYDPPAQVMDESSANMPLDENFYCGPTGRKSNVIYDVRHAVLTAIVDYERLPELFRAINEVNFMTVLNCSVEQVDEYQALTEGYMYGSSDCVKINMVIESIWLREWTKKIMPERTLQYVGLMEAPDAVGNEMMVEDY